MMMIDLRFSDLKHPTPEPGKTIYSDLVDLPGPVVLGVTVRAYNYDNVTLYMKVDATLAGWSFGSVELGAIGAGGNIRVNLDDFGSRTKPVAELTETIVLRLRAFTDSGYTSLKWTFERDLVVVFIKSDDGSWATVLSNNFDDGTVQGWAVEDLVGSRPVVIENVSDFVLSIPNSCRMDQYCLVGSVYIGNEYLHGLFVWLDAEEIVHLGKVYSRYVETDYVPRDKWMRIVLPLPVNDTFELGIVHDWSMNAGWGNWWGENVKGRLYKSITTPLASEAFAIINVRLRGYRQNMGPPTNNRYHGITQIDDILIISR